MADLTKQFDTYVRNMNTAMKQYLADDLGVDVNAVEELGVGFYPKEQVYIFAERDVSGRVCGLVRRSYGGNKYMIEGSKRGLSFATTMQVQSPQTRGVRWVRCSPTSGISCPICGRTKYCMVSSDNPYDPQAVMCTKIEEGSDPDYQHEDGEMFLHIRKPGGRLRGSLSLLPPSDYPIIVVEGQTDTLAAMTLGFVAVGKPSALGGGKMLATLLAGRDVIVIGENDGGDGMKGMEATVTVLKDGCKSVRGILPPDGVKDFRVWLKRASLTRDDLLAYVEEYSADSQIVVSRNFQEDNIGEFTQRWLDSTFIQDNLYLLRRHDGMFWKWDGTKYCQFDKEAVINTVWKFASECTLTVANTKNISVKNYPMTLSKANSVFSAASSLVAVNGNTPQWLDGQHPNINPANIVAFRNGLLDVSTWILHDPTPLFFSYNGLPFDYDPDIDYSWWADLVLDIMEGDEESVRLLQQWFGYNLLADNSQEKMMIFIGPTRSGKGTMLHALESILGSGQVAACDLASLAGRFGYEPLVGKLAVTIGDASLPRHVSPRAALEKLLSIVGQDGVSIDRKGIQAVHNVRLHCRFTIATNFALALDDRANALIPRLNIIDFTNSYVGREDRDLKRKIARHANGIAVWALCGLDDLRKNGSFVEPAKSQRRSREMANCNSHLRDFIHTCCTVKQDVSVPWHAFRMAYNNWAVDNGFHRSNSNDLKQELQLILREVSLKQQPAGSTTALTCIGIELTTDTEETYIG